jgi:hypothetical protein
MWKRKQSVLKPVKTSINATESAQISRNDYSECGVENFGQRTQGVFRPDPEPPAISSCWRKNISFQEAAELANLLRALRKVAGHLGDNVGRIEYAGMSPDGQSGILIEPETVMGQYPVPTDKVDFLVGLVVHRALHRMEWSDHVWKSLEPIMLQMTPRAMVIFQQLVRFGEAIFMDLRSAQTVFGLYAKIVRDKAIRQDRLRFSSCRLCVDLLMTMWRESAFNPHPAPDIPPEYDSSFKELTELTRELKAIAQSNDRVTRRCDQRAGLYRDAWIKIEPGIIQWKIIDKHLV